MNSVNIIGRLTKDPAISYSSGNQMAIAKFTLAIDRPKNGGQDRGADFPSCVAFGKTAEVIEKWAHKGDRLGLAGRIQTGSHDHRDGHKVYTTDVIVDKVYFLEKKQKDDETAAQSPTEGVQQDIMDGYQQIEEDMPF